MTIRGCGKITAWTIRAYTEDISRFATAKTGKAEEGTKAVFGKPRARVEFNTPEMIDIYSPVVGDVF